MTRGSGAKTGRSAWARCGVLACATAAAVLVSARLLLASSASPARYDYIIVGGGATGSVVAGRLGEAGYSVLVLEAGGPTQESLGGTDAVLGGKRTIFDVPLGWVQASQFVLRNPCCGAYAHQVASMI